MKYHLLGLMLLGTGVGNARELDLGIRPNETLRLTVKELHAENYTDGVGDNEFRVVVKFQPYNNPKGIETALRPSTLARSRKFYLATQKSLVNPPNGQIDISGAELKRLVDSYRRYNLTNGRLLIILEEVDPLVSDTVCQTLVDFRDLHSGRIVAEDWAGDPEVITYEVNVSDYTYVWMPDGNGGGYMMPLYAGSHKETRSTVIGGGSKAKIVIHSDIR